VRRRRAGRCGPDDGSIVLALLVTLVGVMLSSLLVPMVLTQVRGTVENAHRVGSLAAAQTGLDVAVAQIRAADDGTGIGTLSKLPCGPLAGPVSAVATAGRYQVTIDYFLLDPQAKSDAWIATYRMPCLPGGGTATTPSYALFRSYGTDVPTGTITSVPNRMLRATYTLQTSNRNISGGLVHVYQTATSTDLCMDAGSSSPAAGADLRMQPCVDDSLQQVFAYNTNLTLALVNSKTGVQPLGMCLDAGAVHAVGNSVVFQPCAAITQPRQQWSINDSANLEGTTDGNTLDNYCFNVQTPNTPASLVVLGQTSGSDCHQGYDNIETWSPDAEVGAGAAGDANKQFVNFSEFGRCLDVTEQNVAYAYLISWPCKQAPNPINVTWNQKWALPMIVDPATNATGHVTTTPLLVPYCLRSPGSIAAGQYVTVVLCSTLAAGAIAINWKVYGDTGAYATSYQMEDGYGFCLQATDPAAIPPDFYPNGRKISKIVVATCTGSALQKWNAPPTILQATPLKDITEK
jgi:Ricin-type beta-trefoil lectin domain